MQRRPKSFSEMSTDEYLGSRELYREMTPRDGSCVFRAVSKQLFSSQIHHLEVSSVRQHQSEFGSASAGHLEIKALSMIRQDFLEYQYSGRPPTCATENGFEDKVRLEPGEKYYNAHIQEVGQDSNTLLAPQEIPSEKHTVPLANLKPVTQVAPDIAWNIAHSQRVVYQKVTGGYISKIEMDLKTQKRMPKNIRGKEALMTMAYSRGQPVLPPQLQHGAPSGRFPPIHCFQGGASTAPYQPGYQQNPLRRHRGSRMLSWYSHRLLQCVKKECQYSFVAGAAEEPQGPEETVTSCEIEGDDDTAFPALPVSYEQRSNSSTAPIVHGPGAFWVARSPNSVPSNKQTLSALEEEEEASENDPNCETAAVFSSAEPTANLMLVNSATVSTPTDAYTASATGFSPNSAASTPASVITTAPLQTAVQPVIASLFPVGRPADSSVSFPINSAPLPPVSEVGEASASLPAYSCDPSSSDLPQDTNVLQNYFNLGLQRHWPSRMYVPPVPLPSPVEVYPAYAEPAPVLDQPVPQLFPDAGQAEVYQVPLGASANGNSQNIEPPPLSYGPVYYPVVSDPFSQQPLPGFESLVPAYRYIGTCHPVNPPHGNSPSVAEAGNSRAVPQVSYMASLNPAPPDAPQGM